MKKTALLSILAATLLAGFDMHTVHAANLQLTGLGRPGACSASFTGGNVIDYGKIASASLTRGQYHQLPVRSVNFRIACDFKAKIGLRFYDNRANSRVEGIRDVNLFNIQGYHYGRGNFGLGKASERNIGGYILQLGSNKVDGSSVTNIYSDKGQTWYQGVDWAYHDGMLFAFSTPAQASSPTAGKTFDLNFNVRPFLDKPENLDLNQGIRLDGSATIEIFQL